ncbi:ATP-dependent helicase [Sutterella sp.]|uniref:ATP-dependent helicase n=1 Tax=Sutterella sp. TaxID=1981025 RepID=UPI0026E04784|nr:UvrD-helicase domain-containing protein [Sutterella sp.]MDO5531727.1 UvrD-helicase domain-containing protein [Sutterella sp.]
MSNELLENLNPMQMKAVTAPEESVLILAGAGSGKTRVLTTRVAWLVEEHLATTSEILAVTFTNKAAKEMLTRLEGMLPYDLRRMWVGTFHGLCNRILRYHAAEAGLTKSFQILDSADQLSLVKRLIKNANLDPDKVDAKSVCSFINNMKEQGLRSNVLGRNDGTPEQIDLFRAYDAECQKTGVVDFAELLLRCYELLERNELIRVHYQKRFRHILVDEFQDTNVLQYRWLKILGGAGLGPGGTSLNSVFAVGDDDQSIYSFRGANVGNMRDFLDDFKVKEPIRLEQNYRSTKTILDAANALISVNSARLGKNLWTSGSKGERIVVQELPSDRDEARWVAEQMMIEHERGAAWRDFAILYRTNAQSRSMEAELASRGIDYRIYGGLRFFERAEVKNVLAYLRVVTNPWDDTSLLRIINTPTRGIGAVSVAQIQEYASQRGVSLWQAITDPACRTSPRIKAFSSLIVSTRVGINNERLPLLEAIQRVIDASGLEAMYAREADGEDRIANMREILSAARGWLENEGVDPMHPTYEALSEADDAANPMTGFLAQATLEAGDRNEAAGADAVQMMTVHSAKGLEFPWVWIIGAEDGIFPHFSHINAARNDGNVFGLEEERRLMYVAITRAKKHLAITHCREHMLWGNTFRNPVSRFVEEVPEELLDRRKLKGGYDDDDDEDDDWSDRRSRGPSRGYGERSGGADWSSRRTDYGSRRSQGGGSGGYGGQGGSSGSGGFGGGREKGGFGRESGERRSTIPKWTGGTAGRKTAGHDGELYVGRRVNHIKFGEGEIVSMEGDPKWPRLRIKFLDWGTKTLDYSVCKALMRLL